MKVTRLSSAKVSVAVTVLAVGILGTARPSEAVPFVVIIPNLLTINTAIVDGKTGIDIPIWIQALEAIDLPAPGVASIATFNWPIGGPGGPYGATHQGSYALHEAIGSGVTASLELRVGANGAHVAAGQVVTDGTNFGFENGFANLPFLQNATFVTPEAAGLHLVLHLQGWQPNFDSTKSFLGTDLFWHLAIGQHHTFPNQNLIFFEPSTGPAIRMGALGSSGAPWIEGTFFDPSLPTTPTYTPIQQVSEVPSLLLSTVGTLMVVFRTRLSAQFRRRPRRRRT